MTLDELGAANSNSRFREVSNAGGDTGTRENTFGRSEMVDGKAEEGLDHTSKENEEPEEGDEHRDDK